MVAFHGFSTSFWLFQSPGLPDSVDSSTASRIQRHQERTTKGSIGVREKRWDLASGKRTELAGKSPLGMGKSTLINYERTIFHGKLLVYQRVTRWKLCDQWEIWRCDMIYAPTMMVTGLVGGQGASLSETPWMKHPQKTNEYQLANWYYHHSTARLVE